ncbi:putative toxin-antitoxin system toxin component, PIN family [Alkalinema sp. FACHB-956]|uniref:putative toxin-antitoxin system toxin component, PIN family n=1 Tax=Alkalinema sp. FACHB-956 TaxID=2692768 RepID=UPI001688B867|nr:putative toxin-antitoxin system toxin component, PIN family [Alkalinema sp. FACHB-956]MBD2326719.1 putative toxin-antitoxin system toxin component, PIN family [Alkalinema sp. FACHB-956]
MYVFDCNVWIAALRSRQGASFVILQAVQRRLIFGAVSAALFLEYLDVVGREANREAFWASDVEVDTVMEILADRLIAVPIYFQWRPQLRDPNDEMVLECAINVNARGIVTFNQRDFLPAATQFGIELIQPRDLVKQYDLVRRLGE